MRNFSKRLATLGIALGLLGVSQNAQAGLSLTFSNGTISQTFNETAPNSGLVVVPTGTLFDGFLINGSASGPPLTTGPTDLQVASNSLDITTTSAAVGETLTVTEVSTGGAFIPSSPAVSLSTLFLPTSTLGATTYSVTASGTGGSASLSGSGATPLSGVSTNFAPGAASDPFTVTNVVTFKVTHTGTINESITTTLSAVPEPATLAMAFSALPLLGLAAWRNRRKSA